MFQSTRPGGRDLPFDVKLIVADMFQSTRPGGARPLAKLIIALIRQVSIHAPRQGATRKIHSATEQISVSIHAPRRGATRSAEMVHELHVSIRAPAGATAHSGCTGKHIQCFNPRAPARRGVKPTMFFIMLRLFQSRAPAGRDSRYSAVDAETINVSIHAPRRGATFTQACPARHFVFQSTRPGGATLRFPKAGTIRVSIHAPRRARLPTVPRQDTTYQFQSTRPGGARHSTIVPRQDYHIVSIHAPGGRDVLCQILATLHVSIPRPAGATVAAWLTCPSYLFQSTRPAGRDTADFHARLRVLVSIHAPRRARPPHPIQSVGAGKVSIHAPRRGATWHRESALREWLEFQSTRPGGARHMIGGDTHSDGQFQSTRPGGARHQQAVRQPRHGRVSIHAPRRGATSASHIYIFSIIGFNPRAPAGRDTHYLCQWE